MVVQAFKEPKNEPHKHSCNVSLMVCLMGLCNMNGIVDAMVNKEWKFVVLYDDEEDLVLCM